LIVSVISIYLSINQFKSKCIQIGGINHSSVVVSLRKIPKISSKVVDTLDVGEFMSLDKPHSTWKHYYSLSNHLVVRKKDFTLGYSKICNIFIVKTEILEIYMKLIMLYSLPIVILMGLLLIGLLVNGYISKIYIKLEGLKQIEDMQIKKEQDLKTELNYRNEIKEKDKIIASLEDKNNEAKKLIINTNKNFTQKINDREDEIVDLKNKNMQLNKKSSLEIKEYKKKIEEEFYRQAKEEIDVIYKNDIEEMKKTTSTLEKKYEKAKEDANILGVDLNDSNIDGLVKGRLFELFCATIWNDDNKTVIGDWTPDKGINENIYVASNGNPDFLIFFSDLEKKVAIECKFRSKFKSGFTNLGSNKSIDRYSRYKIRSTIDVYILLGIEGDPKKPDNLYLIPLDKVEFIRTIDKFHDNLNTTKKRLSRFLIEKNTLVEKMIP